MTTRTTQQIFLTKYAHTSCLAIMQAEQVVYFDVVYDDRRDILGDIYLGIVVRVLPAIQAAFVDIGRQRLGFLAYRDAPLSTHLYAGQRLLVQVIKDEIDEKGARLSTRIAIARRHLVLQPNADMGFSSSKQQVNAKQLLTIVQTQASIDPPIGRYVIRSRAREDGICAEYHDLQKLWRDITEQKTGKKPKLLYASPSLIMRAFYEWMCDDSDIYITDKADFERLSSCVEQYAQNLNVRLHHVDNFASIEDVYHGLFDKTVPLPSGGTLIIDENVAMSVIDVNTGALTASTNTINQTNQEAAITIAEQLRLRQMGGLIVVDFINTTSLSDWQDAIQTLKVALRTNEIHSTVTTMEKHALVVISRQRLRPSITNRMCVRCPTCNGQGRIKSFNALTFELFRKVLTAAQSHPHTHSITINGHPDFIAHLRSDMALIDELISLSTKNIHLVEKMSQISHYQLIFS